MIGSLLTSFVACYVRFLWARYSVRVVVVDEVEGKTAAQPALFQDAVWVWNVWHSNPPFCG